MDMQDKEYDPIKEIKNLIKGFHHQGSIEHPAMEKRVQRDINAILDCVKEICQQQKTLCAEHAQLDTVEEYDDLAMSYEEKVIGIDQDSILKTPTPFED